MCADNDKIESRLTSSNSSSSSSGSITIIYIFIYSSIYLLLALAYKELQICCTQRKKIRTVAVFYWFTYK